MRKFLVAAIFTAMILVPAAALPPTTAPPAHRNLRGAAYFRSTSPGDVDPCSSNPPSIH